AAPASLIEACAACLLSLLETDSEVATWRDLKGAYRVLALVTTRDGENRSGDIACFTRCQKADGGSLFIQRAVALHQGRIYGLVNNLLVPLLFLLIIRQWPTLHRTRRSQGATWCGGHDAHIVVRCFMRESRNNTVDSALGSGIRHTVNTTGRRR